MDNQYVDYPAMCQLAVTRYNRGDIPLSEMQQICAGPSWWDQHGTAVIIAIVITFFVILFTAVYVKTRVRTPRT